ncbi:class I SAM-dependent methyltransferase [Haloarcula halophila]|uniref:class I SAM-dependent methyltransferase n=1 Tax=Haloarcula TaxID=2237 RepID=UPI0023E3FE5B|nr:class I SAM-dependent methyltransferase [Halomicroarcula sp. DFY41]
MDHAQVRYLEAKRTVDERALNRRVRDALVARLPDAPSVVEFAPGTGVTVPRLLDWGLEPSHYVGIEQDRELVESARETHRTDLEERGYTVTRTDDGFAVGPDGSVEVEFVVGDATAVEDRDADLVIAQAFADLVAHDVLLDAIDRALGPEGLAYLPITFDGTTLFQPDHPADDRIERAYHDSIAGQPGRDPRTGRHLMERFRAADGELLAAGSSDWIVRPRAYGYPADERYFLECILGFVADAVADGPVDGAQDWLATRRRQLADEALTYVAHQYDLLYAP